MNILKRKVSLILSVIMVALAIFPLTISSAASQVTMSVELEGTEMEYAGTYKVTGGEKITVKASSSQSSIAYIGYYYKDKGVQDSAAYNNKTVIHSSSCTITVPTYSAGTTKVLWIEAVAANDDGTPNEETKTGWQGYYLEYVEESDEVNMDVVVKHNGKVISNGSTTTVEVGDKLEVSATPSDRVTKIYYVWDKNKDDMKVENGSKCTVTIPSSFESTENHSFHVIVEYDNGEFAPQEDYYLELKQEPETDEFDMDVVVKHNGKVISNGSTTTVEVGDKLEVSATPSGRVTKIYYVWDKNKDDMKDADGSKCTVTIPSSFESTENHSFHVIVEYDNGEFAPQEDYYLKIKQASTNLEDDELDILPWEEDNDDLDALSISLRNDSESEKANKNLYALNEDVTYYIDFRNGGKDISDEVTITLELPLEFKVVDAANGVVDTDKGTITWVYPNGMEADYEGTKTVVIKYVAFDRNSTDSEKIYPLATIAKKDKIMDDSAVINYIYRDSDTVIEDTHEPYMYGDYSTSSVTTFRPDATITRAEGALVLTRILLGQEAIDNVQVTSVYPDLDETYLEAQKAIIAATEFKLINGYTDGYYRPNQPMTRAEFMKIIAKFVELDAEDNGIDGLRIKEIEEAVKLYDDPQGIYGVNGQLVNNHWALEEVSLLVRLNMTSVDSAKKHDLRMDAGITRAEVAQLVNFYLLRGPAEVTRKTKTQFSDVAKHDLLADIVEATRDAHDYTITEDGTEIAE